MLKYGKMTNRDTKYVILQSIVCFIWPPALLLSVTLLALYLVSQASCPSLCRPVPPCPCLPRSATLLPFLLSFLPASVLVLCFRLCLFPACLLTALHFTTHTGLQHPPSAPPFPNLRFPLPLQLFPTAFASICSLLPPTLPNSNFMFDLLRSQETPKSFHLCADAEAVCLPPFYSIASFSISVVLSAYP